MRMTAQIVFAGTFEEARGVWRFEVTVRYKDKGWDLYEDLWPVSDPKGGGAITERVLPHMHEVEQPTTRSLGGVEIPNGTSPVTVRACRNIFGYGGSEVLVDLTVRKQDGFEVTRP
ncbi:MAG: hypothetical protein JXQ30_01510 [Spirochaetes bacterium]|nr:hypothetical protein [Spirochaetota bacterium]